jgi:XTP/dITP diphosphohydrolase
MIQTLILASSNAHKAKELTALLDGIRVIPMRDAGLNLDIEETGTTFAENAMLKARAVFDASGLASVADDSGLAVDALGGRPGIYSARYGGDGATDADRYRKLLRELHEVPDEKRTARFICAMACVLDCETAFVVEGTCEGVILRAPRGENGFGYDPVFLIPERGLTLSEMPPEEKNQISHRARASFFLRERLISMTRENR